ncbi:MAG: hypothetical protein QG670_35 [Thermoproteota archaeon]|nr:hypothetical protein [Thermoproteota archaeon]
MSNRGEESRKVQVTGKSTYIVSLPKKWVEAVKLGRGEQIELIEQDDLSLLLMPKSVVKEKAKDVEIKISPKDNPNSIIRRVISFYLIGYNLIRVTTKDRFTPEQREKLKDFIRKKLVGAEIIADSKNEVALQTLLNYSELSVENALRRMSVITTSMHRDAMVALGENDHELAQTIIQTDDEVDRFSFYIIRLLKYAVGDSRILKEIGLTTTRDCLGFRLILKSVERAADHATSIARNILTMKPIDSRLFKKVSEMSDFAISIFDESINSLFAKDYKLADEILMRKEGIETYDAEISKDMALADTETRSTLRLIRESIRRLNEYGSDIAEIVLNLTAESTKI